MRVQGEGFSGSADSLETFLERLRDRCQDNGECHGPDRAGRIQEQARCARALAVEFGILKQYHGIPAEPRDIERGFLAAGWTRLKDPSGHVIFFNHAFRVMAIDAERRNCYLTDGQLQPFDVILCTPDDEMERYLGIYPRE